MRQGIAFVQEGKRIFHRRTVEENLLLGGYARGIGRRGLRADIARVYELFPALPARAKTVAGPGSCPAASSRWSPSGRR